MNQAASAVAICPHCRAPCSEADDYCGACGRRLAELVLEKSKWVLDERQGETKVVIKNQGIRAASIVLRGRDAAALPSWIQSIADVDRAITLPPKSEVTFSMKLAPGEVEPGQVGLHRLPILTSMWEMAPDSGDVQRRFLTLELATAGRAKATPGAMWLRFVPRQLVDKGEIVAERIVVRNEGGHPIELTRARVHQAAALAPLPKNQTRLDASQALVLPPWKAPVTLAPAQSHEIGFAIKLEAGVLDEGAVGMFQGQIQIDVAGQPPVIVPVGGTIGTGPTLACDQSDPVVIHCQGRTTRAQLELRNPGAAAVTITAIDIESDDDESGGPASAWLSASWSAELPLTLEPEQARTLFFTADPSGRDGAHMENPWGQSAGAFASRRLRIPRAASFATRRAGGVGPRTAPRARGFGRRFWHV